MQTTHVQDAFGCAADLGGLACPEIKVECWSHAAVLGRGSQRCLCSVVNHAVCGFFCNKRMLTTHLVKALVKWACVSKDKV
jgi:hypothetical protein